MRERVKISQRGSVREIVIRDLVAPYSLHLLLDDLWRYLVLRRVIKDRYDAAVFGGPGNALLAWLLKRSGRVVNLIYDDHDYFAGQEEHWFTRQLLSRRERFCVRRADGVVSANTMLAGLRRQQGARHIRVVPNGVDLSTFSRGRQKVPHPPTLIYMGHLSPLWQIDLAISALPRLLQTLPDVRLIVVGAGWGEADLKALSRTLGVADQVSFLGRLEYQALPAVLAKADVGLATSRLDSDFRKYASPMKLIEYMAAGLPVIASRLGQTEITMEQAGAGILIDNSVDEFVAAAVSLLSDRDLYEQCSQAGIDYAAGFDWDHLMDEVYKYILHVVLDDKTSDSTALGFGQLDEAGG